MSLHGENNDAETFPAAWICFLASSGLRRMPFTEPGVT